MKGERDLVLLYSRKSRDKDEDKDKDKDKGLRGKKKGSRTRVLDDRCLLYVSVIRSRERERASLSWLTWFLAMTHWLLFPECGFCPTLRQHVLY